jgi:ubiquinone/menaquinone biosynthesis C-methylase UbiE/uncharacterized protein YbaR (Trm112 family)
MSAASHAVALCCPACRGPLEERDGSLGCDACGRSFGHVAGIPDLRLPGDVSAAGEAEALADGGLERLYDQPSFGSMLQQHWAATDRPAVLQERFLAGERASLERSIAYLAEVERHRDRPIGSDDRVLEAGCGTATLAVAAAAKSGHVAASDISMRWLLLARKRLEESGDRSVQLVCAAGESLPFPDASFDVMLASDVIEHVADQEAFIRSCRRVLKPGGVLFLATPNRFSLGLEPHVRLWGVGLLPRRLATRYVHALRKVPYEGVRLLSARGLKRLLSANGFAVRVVSPQVPAATATMYSGLERRLVLAYNRALGLPVARPLLLVVGPFFHVFATRR